MKKLITMVALVAAMYGAVSAQMSVTPKIGVNITNMSVEDVETSSTTGFKIGAEFNKNLGSIVTGLELAYAQKGATTSISFFGLTSDMTATTNYIEINPVIGYDVKVAGLSIIPRLKPSLGILLGGSYEGTLFGAEIEATDIPDGQMETIDFGLDFGVDVVIIEKIAIGIGYNLGFLETSALTDEEAAAAMDEDVIVFSGTNSAIGITVGYKIGL